MKRNEDAIIRCIEIFIWHEHVADETNFRPLNSASTTKWTTPREDAYPFSSFGESWWVRVIKRGVWMVQKREQRRVPANDTRRVPPRREFSIPTRPQVSTDVSREQLEKARNERNAPLASFVATVWKWKMERGNHICKIWELFKRKYNGQIHREKHIYIWEGKMVDEITRII